MGEGTCMLGDVKVGISAGNDLGTASSIPDASIGGGGCLGSWHLGLGEGTYMLGVGLSN